MNRYARLLTAATLAGLLAACGAPASDPSSSASPEPMASMAATTPPAASPPPESSASGSAAPASGGMDHSHHTGTEIGVRIDNFAFVDDAIEVRAGTTVTWVNGDGVGHTITSGGDDTPDGRFDADIPAGGTFSFTFEEAGEYPYFCDIHPTMTGLVVVTP
jgi:plastocyanin